MKQKLTTYENSPMSLSCYGECEIENGVIKSVRCKGMARSHGDEWIRFYENSKTGDKVSQETIDKILSYNGRNNVVSTLEIIEMGESK